MRVITSMKNISNDCLLPWILNNDYLNALRLFHYYEEMGFEIYTPKLSKCCGSIFRFYCRLVNMLENILDKDDILDEGDYYLEDGQFDEYEDGYFDEDD
jgi:hypothetical protein